MKAWPGWDGAALIAVSVASVGVWLARGQLGGDERLLLVLLANVVWLGVTWWSRRGSPS